MRVNEIFYSLQGEGFHTGTAAVFVRLSGCNLRCPFCDTDFDAGTEMDEDEIALTVAQWPATIVVVTGGEPSLQLTATLVERLHDMGRRVHVETNGTHPLPHGVDWVTLSPKDKFVGEGGPSGGLGNAGIPVITEADELKIVFDGVHEPDPYTAIAVRHARFLQPCDTGDAQRNRQIERQAIDYIKRHPQWRLSLQTHKMLGIR